MTADCFWCMTIGAFCAGIGFGTLGLVLVWWRNRS
jgi:hypothetical protein